MPGFWIQQNAASDLREIWASDPNAGAPIGALLRQLSADPELRQRLTQEDFGTQGVDRFNVDAYSALQQRDLNIWRLKLWSTHDQSVPYRVVYALNKDTGDYIALAIIHRDFDYDINHPTVRRVIFDYERLGIPTISGR